MRGDNSNARTWGMLCHLAALAGFVVPFGHVFGPLIVWLIKKEEDSFIDAQGKESLSFQVSWTMYAAIVGITLNIIHSWVLASSTNSSNFLLWIALIVFLLPILVIILVILLLILVIFAAVKAKKGEFYYYPFTIRFLR